MDLKRADIFSPVAIILIIANLVALNLWTSHLFGHIDLTENKMFTLSPVTKKVLRDLDEPLTIKAFFTRQLPAPYNNTARFVEDQLAEMKAYGKGNFRYEFLDPTDEEDLKKEAEKYRLQPMQVNEMRADKVEFKLVYLGMAIIYQDKQEVIPAVQPQNLGNLEYEIISKIKRITSPETPTVGFLEGHGEPSLSKDMTQLEAELKKLYEVKPVNLSSRYTIPKDIDLLCLIGPNQDIPEKDRFAIDQFIMKGGKLFAALNKVDTDISQLTARPSALRIDPWLENYGIKVSGELVMDQRAPTLPFQSVTPWGRQITMVTYPLFPEVVKFNRKNPALVDLRQVRFYFPTHIDTTIAAGMDSVEVAGLIYTSDKTAVQSSPYDINPLMQRGMFTWDKKSLALAALVKGKFKSYFDGKEIPTDSEGNKVSDEPIIPWSSDTRMVFVADANFIKDQFLVPGLDNLTLVLNMVDWLVQDEGLISIRSREVQSRPIGEVGDATRKLVKYLNLLIPPLLVIGYGLIRWRIRAARRQRLELMTKGTGGAL